MNKSITKTENTLNLCAKLRITAMASVQFFLFYFFYDNFMTILYLVGSFFANCNFWLFLIRFLGSHTYYKKAF